MRLREKGEFSPRLHSRFSRRSCSSDTKPAWQSQRGSSRAARQPGFCANFWKLGGARARKQEAPSFCHSRGPLWEGGPGEYWLTCSLLKNRRPLMHTRRSASCPCGSLAANAMSGGEMEHFWYSRNEKRQNNTINKQINKRRGVIQSFYTRTGWPVHTQVIQPFENPSLGGSTQGHSLDPSLTLLECIQLLCICVSQVIKLRVYYGWVTNDLSVLRYSSSWVQD